jgi:predicted phosphoribosyltransferase
MFRNRQHAGSLLSHSVAQALENSDHFDSSEMIIVALPRGGVAVALEIAQALDCPLDVLVSKKIGAPDQSELAIGAVTSDGIVVINDELTDCLGIANDYIESKKQYLMRKTRAQEEHWRSSAGMNDRLDVRGKQVILVDDGIATGMTALAAARSIRRRGAKQLVLATPVMSCHAYTLLEDECDRIVALSVLIDFAAIGQFYLDFHQVEEREVIGALRQSTIKRSEKKGLAIS